MRLLWVGSNEIWEGGSLLLAACRCPKIPPVVMVGGLSTHRNHMELLPVARKGLAMDSAALCM